MHTFRFYIGTHASAGQDSLCLCEADFSSGTFSTLRTMRELSDPTYLALSSQKVLYALSRSGSKGSVNAIREHAIVSTLPSGGSGPCHICVDDRLMGVFYDDPLLRREVVLTLRSSAVQRHWI